GPRANHDRAHLHPALARPDCSTLRVRMNALRTIIVAVVCFALGAAAGRMYDRRLAGTSGPPPAAANATNHEIDYGNEPLWAYGFETVRKPGEEAAPQNPPSRRLRPNEDATEQTRPQSVAGSRAS